MKNVMVLDTGKEWGGGTLSLLGLLGKINKKKYKFTALFYHNYEKPRESDIKTEMERLGVNFILLESKKQPVLAKVLKEVARVLFFLTEKSEDYLFSG